MKRTKRLLLHSSLPLVLSLLIYVFFRSRSTIVNKLIFQVLGVAPPTLRLSHYRWVVYNLPGALWLYSFLSFSAISTRRRVSLIPLGLALGIEAAQGLHITDGRFDWQDVGFYLLAWATFLGLDYWFSAKPGSLPVVRPPFSRRYKVAFACFIAVVLLSDVWVK
jgi:hypothetical protein